MVYTVILKPLSYLSLSHYHALNLLSLNLLPKTLLHSLNAIANYS